MTKQDLTLVGLTEDKQSLILVSDSGDEFRLPADATLRAALRGENTRLGQLETPMESALRPRDIQSRIRAGESPEVVAAAAQTTVDRIMTFAMPVLAERAHVAERAQRASVRRRTGEGPGGLLGDAVAERLRSRNVDPESVEWDSWRREDGRWTVAADYLSGESARHAEFVYDTQGRYVVAEDDESRWLVGERVLAQEIKEAAADPLPRRLTTVSDEELPLGEDAIELVSEPERFETTADLTEAARALRAVPAEELPISADHADADWMVTQASERPTRTAESEEAPAEPERPSKKAKRASVPSWDEIMFGSSRGE